MPQCPSDVARAPGVICTGAPKQEMGLWVHCCSVCGHALYQMRRMLVYQDLERRCFETSSFGIGTLLPAGEDGFMEALLGTSGTWTQRICDSKIAEKPSKASQKLSTWVDTLVVEAGDEECCLRFHSGIPGNWDPYLRHRSSNG